MSAESALSSPGQADSRIGEVISDRYRILSLLGEGGMGAVYVAEHTLMRKRVALKLLHPEMAENAEVVARFRREAEAVARLDDPHIAAATDFGQTPDGSFFLVLEYIDGVSLRKALRDGPFPLARVLLIARQIALALNRAHSAGIVHRDLKPENVMLVRRDDEADFVKVLDFGVARVEVERGAGQPLTRAGTAIGTPEYMAPEQALGERVTARADLYALGVVMYEMLTARLPFEGDISVLLSLQIVAPVPPMADRAPDVRVPPDAEALVMRLLEKSAEARHASAAELIDAIDVVARANGIELIALPRSSGRLSVPELPALERSSVVVRASAPTVAPSKNSGDALAHTIAAMPTPVAPGTPGVPPSPIERVLAFARGPQVQTFVTTLRRQAEELIAALQTKTKLPRATVIAALVGVLALVLGVGGTTVLVLLFSRKPVAATATVVTGPATEASPEAIREAAARGAPALEALAERFPTDRAVLRELAFDYDRHERNGEALSVVERMARLGSGPIPPELVRLVIRASTKSESTEQAFRLLEETLGTTGVDALVEMRERKDLPEGIRVRAAASLAKESVRAKTTPATRFLIELDGAATCDARRAVLERSGEDADTRALSRLQALKSTRGCGRGGRYDCNACLRTDDVLERALKAAAR